MSVFMLCERAIGMVRGKRLVLSASEKTLLEALNYEGLANAHAQEEAVTCARHFAFTRDRLLQLHPWAFARKTANLTATTRAAGWTYAYSLPADCLTVLAALSGDEPVEWEKADGKLLCNAGSVSIRYTARITDTGAWEPAFEDAFCAALAGEIAAAVTGEPQLLQMLEQRAQLSIDRARQLGVIQPETRIPLKDELCNRAVGLIRGQRLAAASSEAAQQNGMDHAGLLNVRQQEEAAACKRALEPVRDRLLQLHPWVFARKTASLTATTKSAGWDYAFTLPANCLTVLAALSNDEPVEWEEAEGKLLCNASSVSIRYTAKMTSGFPPPFTDALCAAVAAEVAMASAGNPEVAAALEQQAQAAVQRAAQLGVIQGETRIPVKDKLCARAMSLAEGTWGLSPSAEDEATSHSIDRPGRAGSRWNEGLRTVKRSFDSVRDRLLKLHPWVFARRTAAPARLTDSLNGWKYAFALPTDCLKLRVVVVDDMALTHFEIVDGKLLCNHDPVHIRYTAKVTDTSKWGPEFEEPFVSLLAAEAVRAVTGNGQAAAALEQRAEKAIQDGYMTGVIRGESGLPVRTGAWLDYSGVPTRFDEDLLGVLR